MYSGIGRIDAIVWRNGNCKGRCVDRHRWLRMHILIISIHGIPQRKTVCIDIRVRICIICIEYRLTESLSRQRVNLWNIGSLVRHSRRVVTRNANLVYIRTNLTCFIYIVNVIHLTLWLIVVFLHLVPPLSISISETILTDITLAHPHYCFKSTRNVCIVLPIYPLTYLAYL